MARDTWKEQSPEEATIPRTRAKIVDTQTGEDITGAVVRCRTYGHAWDEFFPINMSPAEFGWRLSLRCTRCTTERHDQIDSIGQVTTRHYLYPDGYSTRFGDEDKKMSRPEYRQLLYERFRKKARLNQGAA